MAKNRGYPSGGYTRATTASSVLPISNASVTDLAGATGRINQLLAEGSLTARRIETSPLSDAAEAHRRLEAGEARGRRIVLRPPA